MKSGDFSWMKERECKASKGTNVAMKETKKLLMKIAGAK
jgi:hypothetical protein